MSSSNSLIRQVLQMAKHTFARVPLNGLPRQKRHFLLAPEDFKLGIKQLKELMDGLRDTDLGLDKSQLMNSEGYVREPKEPPITYIKIHEDSDISIGIFIIKPGCRIPLHNHPNMHGLLKVVSGQVNVNVYTKWIPKKGDTLEIPPFLQDKQHFIKQGLVFPTEKVSLKEIDSSYETLLLSPDQNNFHEIQTLGDGPAAFFDILAPPYHTETFEDEIRECYFFSEIAVDDSNNSNNNIHSDSPKLIWLRRTKVPDDYDCDQEPYLGPTL